MPSNTVRPTNVSEDLYIKFAYKCRENRSKISEVLEKLMKLYIEKGNKLFES